MLAVSGGKSPVAMFEQLRQQDAAARQYERTAAHLQKFVDRFRAQATKARQAQSRLKMLERLTAIEPARAKREWRFEFLEPLKLPERLIDAEGLMLGCITEREDPADALVVHEQHQGRTLATQPEGAVVGTSSRSFTALVSLRPKRAW